MKKLVILALCVLLVIGIAACESRKPNADRAQARATETALSEANRQIGMPNIVNFQQRKQMKWIYELADREDLITYTYIKAEMTGKLIFVGKSIGYGIPFSAQFTNPEKVVQADHEVGYDISGIGPLITKPQADPNGLFMPTSSSATWMIMIDPYTGEPRPQYWEDELTISPFPLYSVLTEAIVTLPNGFETEDDWGKNAQKAQ